MKKSYRMRFTVGSLLILMAAIAGYFFGFNKGDIDKYLTTMSQSTYPVAELLAPDRPAKEQMEEIANLVEQAIAPDSWISRGGPATLTLYESNQSIVINQFGKTHRDIESLFSSLHELAEQRKKDRVIAISYSLKEVIGDSISRPIDEQLEVTGVLIQQALRPAISIGQEFKLQTDLTNLAIVISTNESFHALVKSQVDFLKRARKSISAIDGGEPPETVGLTQASKAIPQNIVSQPIGYRSNGTVVRTSDK